MSVERNRCVVRGSNEPTSFEGSGSQQSERQKPFFSGSNPSMSFNACAPTRDTSDACVFINNLHYESSLPSAGRERHPFTRFLELAKHHTSWASKITTGNTKKLAYITHAR